MEQRTSTLSMLQRLPAVCLQVSVLFSRTNKGGGRDFTNKHWTDLILNVLGGIWCTSKKKNAGWGLSLHSHRGITGNWLTAKQLSWGLSPVSSIWQFVPTWFTSVIHTRLFVSFSYCRERQESPWSGGGGSINILQLWPNSQSISSWNYSVLGSMTIVWLLTKDFLM